MPRTRTSGRQSDEHYERLRKKCGHPPERRVPKAGNSPGATQCLDCRNERDRGHAARAREARRQQMEELGISTTKPRCGHPEDRFRVVKRTGRKDYYDCLDCRNERRRARTKARQEGKPWPPESDTVVPLSQGVSMTDNGTPPSDEVLRGALCGDTADDRFVMLPSLLSEQDRDELDRWCSSCPVWMGCFTWALENKYFLGVAGAHTFGMSKTGKRVIAPLRAAQEGAA